MSERDIAVFVAEKAAELVRFRFLFSHRQASPNLPLGVTGSPQSPTTALWLPSLLHCRQLVCLIPFDEEMHLLIWVLSLATFGALASRSPIWPQPSHIHLGNETLWFDFPLSFSVDLFCDGHEYSAWSIPAPGSQITLLSRLKQSVLRSLATVQHVLEPYFPQYVDTSTSSSHDLSEEKILRFAVGRTLLEMSQESFVPWKFHQRHSQFEPESTDADSPFKSLSISQRYCPPKSFRPDIFFDGDESYELLIERSVASVRTNSTLGTVRALQSLRQLFYAHSSGGVYTPFQPVHILDLPKWSHRGLSLDIARNAILPEHVIKTIDGMAASKLSRLHLHATDSQSWPIDIPSLPDLAKKGAYQPELVWSSDDLAAVQWYGVQQGVMVFLELDMPGHTQTLSLPLTRRTGLRSPRSPKVDN